MMGSCGLGGSMRGSSSSASSNQDENDYLNTEHWRACAGPIVTILHDGDRVLYFPQGHIEHVEPFTCRDANSQMPIYDLPSKILCQVVNVQLKAKQDTDEVFAHVTLLPIQEHEENTAEKEIVHTLTPKQHVYSFCKVLNVSDIDTHGGFPVPKQHANECLPKLDMSNQSPAQDLVAKDLHGEEWRFRHIYRGNQKRHLLTTGWNSFVSSKKLVVGDAFIFLRGENGELRVGVRRSMKQQSIASASVVPNENMKIGILASARHAITVGTMLFVCFRPRTSPSEFIVPYDHYMESKKNNHSIGMRFQMRFEGENGLEKRYTGIIIGKEDAEPTTWPDSEWKHFKVQWDEMPPVRPERVSPWEIIPFSATHTSLVSRPKRRRPSHLSSPPESSALQRKGSPKVPTESSLGYHGVLLGQEKIPSGLRSYCDNNERGNTQNLSSSQQIPPPSTNAERSNEFVNNKKQKGLENRSYTLQHKPRPEIYPRNVSPPSDSRNSENPCLDVNPNCFEQSDVKEIGDWRWGGRSVARPVTEQEQRAWEALVPAFRESVQFYPVQTVGASDFPIGGIPPPSVDLTPASLQDEIQIPTQERSLRSEMSQWALQRQVDVLTQHHQFSHSSFFERGSSSQQPTAPLASAPAELTVDDFEIINMSELYPKVDLEQDTAARDAALAEVERLRGELVTICQRVVTLLQELATSRKQCQQCQEERTAREVAEAAMTTAQQELEATRQELEAVRQACHRGGSPRME